MAAKQECISLSGLIFLIVRAIELAITGHAVRNSSLRLSCQGIDRSRVMSANRAVDRPQDLGTAKRGKATQKIFIDTDHGSWDSAQGVHHGIRKRTA
jgi:hypothetical protein